MFKGVIIINRHDDSHVDSTHVNLTYTLVAAIPQLCSINNNGNRLVLAAERTCITLNLTKTRAAKEMLALIFSHRRTPTDAIKSLVANGAAHPLCYRKCSMRQGLEHIAAPRACC